jgi:rhodanese-related sulfurtransferase
LIFLLLLSSFTTSLSAAELGNLNPQQILEKPNALIIDIRTKQEWQQTGTIPNSHKLQSFDKQGKFDSSAWLAQLEQLKQSPAQPVILVCRSGNRSEIVGKFLTDKQGMKNVYHLDGGIKSWLSANKQLQNNDCC